MSVANMEEFISRYLGIPTNQVKLTDIQQKVGEQSDTLVDRNVCIVGGCGSGKFEVGMFLKWLWASDTMFLLPRKTLATSLYERAISGDKRYYGKSNWSLQHSSRAEDRFFTEPNNVTTIDQVLGGYYFLGTQDAIKWKNTIQKNLIMDEVQLVDPEKALISYLFMLDTCYAYNRHFAFMSATMPSALRTFLQKRYQMEVIVADKPAVKNRKVYLHYRKEIDMEAINKEESKLILLTNTVREQQVIYEQIEDKERVIVLNNKLLPSDRLKVEEAVERYFGKGAEASNKILLTTNIIEAGMDISAPLMWTTIASVDSLVQREGRICRWGGIGKMYVFEGQCAMYNEGVMSRTREKLFGQKGKEWTWKQHLEWVDEVLNPLYEEILQPRNLQRKFLTLQRGRRSDLIRDIQAVNIIVDENPSIHSFSKESISVSLSELKRKIAPANTLYRRNKHDVEFILYPQVEVGDTLIIKGTDYVYDVLGLRYMQGEDCVSFPEDISDSHRKLYTPYVDEPFSLHAKLVEKMMYAKLKEDKLCEYTTKKAHVISRVAGLHDIGKLDVLWQGENMANAKKTALAHFSHKPKNPRVLQNRNHAVISACILEKNVENILFNVVLQHHGRKILDNATIHLDEYELSPLASKALLEYGWTNPIKKQDKNRDYHYGNGVMHPASPEWGLFLYIVGVLQEADIEAIEEARYLLQ